MRIASSGAAGYMGLAVALTLFGVPPMATAADAPAASPEAQSAVWTPKELTFVYQGFTARYSCDGLRDRMRQVLLDLGARPDLEVSPYGCTATGRPEPFPGVRIKMNVPTPAATGVSAQWKNVDVRLDTDPLRQSGSCELLEQIKQKILPQFTTRKVDFASNCVPNQLSAGGTWLRAVVLVADPTGDKPLASK